MSTSARVGALANQRNLQSIENAPWCQPIPQRKTGCCVQVAVPPIRPDLAIYSQAWQISQGLPPTWNNPDISLINLPNNVLVKVRNLSPVASAINALVTLSISQFGIGLEQGATISQKLNLGPGLATTLSFPIPPPPANLGGGVEIGVGLFVLIEDAYDANPINNVGALMLATLDSVSNGRSQTIPFPVVNSTGSPRTISFSVMANSLGATISPASYAFAPWEQFMTTLNMSVPASMHGSPSSPIQNEVTVVATDAADGSLVGGATWLFSVDD